MADIPSSLEDRVARFRELLPKDGAEMALVTFLASPAADGCCVSCGAGLPQPDDVRCGLCADALWRALFDQARPRREQARPMRSTMDLNEYDD